MVALLVALVGVVGTLVAPITTARVSLRTRLQEFELQQRANEQTRREENMAADLERRRAIYIAVNSSARQWRIRLMEDLHALRTGGSSSELTEDARQAFQGDFAQAQMLVPDPVLDAATRVRIALADGRKRLDSLKKSEVADEEAWQELYTYVLRIWDLITRMQAAMRKDLGIGSGVPVASEQSVVDNVDSSRDPATPGPADHE
ncbi:hypothetical protein [Streptomyces europaeiscabiei]|uniref:hypothetical protein n=1 Tax=Streptomyces europaeiscabiei TaxID=146819 RepID=UPI0029A80684|nr:hypothetical protein [Streptomyces europaeiscabiei]MDX3838964.1 hypothetical protein [Streptomyces europaeiscabiei]